MLVQEEELQLALGLLLGKAFELVENPTGLLFRLD